MARYQQLKSVIKRTFPAGIASETAAATGERMQRDSTSAVWIGAFEVFLISKQSLQLDGAVPLALRSSWNCFSPGGKCLGLEALCIASKLQSRMWPAGDEFVARLAAVMPRVPLRVSIHTELNRPVASVHLTAFQASARENMPRSSCGNSLVDGSDKIREGDITATRQQISTPSFAVASGQTDSDGTCEMMVRSCMFLRV